MAIRVKQTFEDCKRGRHSDCKGACPRGADCCECQCVCHRPDAGTLVDGLLQIAEWPSFPIRKVK